MQITSEAQLKALVAEAETVVESVRVTRDAASKTSAVHVRLFDGREGGRVRTEAGWDVTGALEMREWQLAMTWCAELTRAAKWCDRVAQRFPNFEQQAAGRPVAATFSDFRRPAYQVGQPITDWTDHDAPRVLIVRSIRYQSADAVNERDDASWTMEAVEPTEIERAAQCVRDAQKHADAQVAHERRMLEIEMRNTRGYGN